MVPAFLAHEKTSYNIYLDWIEGKDWGRLKKNNQWQGKIPEQHIGFEQKYQVFAKRELPIHFGIHYEAIRMATHIVT